MNIRAHHLLCMKYFKGRGYSKEFVSNFSKIIKRIGDNPTIKIVNYPDAICRCCPHCSGGRCVKKGPDSEEKVKKKDDIILRHLGINQGKAKDIRNLIDLKLDKLRYICADCEWQSLCSEQNI